MRSHLEERTPLEAQFQVQLQAGRTQWWHMRGLAQRNDPGTPHPLRRQRALTSPAPAPES